MLIYCAIAATTTCVIAPLFSVKRGTFSDNFQIIFLGAFLTFWVSILFFTCTLAAPEKGILFFSNIIIAHFLIAIIFIFIWSFFSKTLTLKKTGIIASLILICIILYKQDQKAILQKMDISTNQISIDTKIDDTTDLSLIDVRSQLTSKDRKAISFLRSIDWQYAYHSKDKKIFWSIDGIAVISKNKTLGYINTPINTFKFLPRNTMPCELLFQNPINLGMAVDAEDTPFFKYVLLKKDGFLGGYHVSGYALCNALTYEIEYYDELPEFAQ